MATIYVKRHFALTAVQIDSQVVECTGELSLEVFRGGRQQAGMRQQKAGDVAEAADDVTTQHLQPGMPLSIHLHIHDRHTFDISTRHRLRGDYTINAT